MTGALERQIAEVTAVHRGLCSISEQEGRTIISGPLSFEAESDGFPVIADSFDIELSVPADYPERLPRARETAGKIESTYEHLYADGAMCLGVPIEERRIFAQQPSLLGFVNGLVVPYLYSYCYHKQHGKYPFDDQLHGNVGILRHYMDALELKDELAALAVISFLFEHGYRGHHPCPCGSGKPVRNCHAQALREMNAYHTPHTLRAEFEAILAATEANWPQCPPGLLRQVQRILKSLGYTSQRACG